MLRRMFEKTFKTGSVTGGLVLRLQRLRRMFGKPLEHLLVKKTLFLQVWRAGPVAGQVKEGLGLGLALSKFQLY